MQSLDHDHIAAVLRRAAQLGLYGYSGYCAAAAVAINRVIFDGKGEIVGAFNEAFSDEATLIGHVVVCYDDVFWDSDARPKDADDIESWGMLDPEDTDYKKRALELGIAYNDLTAGTAAFFALDDEEELFSHFDRSRLDQYVAILRQAVAECTEPTA
jgi:hypothetical protein